MKNFNIMHTNSGIFFERNKHLDEKYKRNRLFKKDIKEIKTKVILKYST